MEKTYTCPHCGQNTTLEENNISQCTECGKFIPPCAMCNADKEKCLNCEYEITTESFNDTEILFVNDYAKDYMKQCGINSLLFNGETIFFRYQQPYNNLDTNVKKYSIKIKTEGNIHIISKLDNKVFTKVQDFTKDLLMEITKGRIYTDRSNYIVKERPEFVAVCYVDDHYEEDIFPNYIPFRYAQLDKDDIQEFIATTSKNEIKILLSTILHKSVKWWQDFNNDMDNMESTDDIENNISNLL